jgi:hypothetical protein
MVMAVDCEVERDASYLWLCLISLVSYLHVLYSQHPVRSFPSSMHHKVEF